jgi:hypothetical protein
MAIILDTVSFALLLFNYSQANIAIYGQGHPYNILEKFVSFHGGEMCKEILFLLWDIFVRQAKEGYLCLNNGYNKWFFVGLQSIPSIVVFNFQINVISSFIEILERHRYENSCPNLMCGTFDSGQ